MTLSLAPMTRAFADEVAAWRYEPPYDCYDGNEGAAESLLDGQHVAILEDGRFVGFVGVGTEARVPGGPPDEDAVTDVGIGLDPRRLSEGLGTQAGALVLETLRLAGHARLRVSVLASNDRSKRLVERLGFTRTGGFCDLEGRRFVVLERDLSPLSG